VFGQLQALDARRPGLLLERMTDPADEAARRHRIAALRLEYLELSSELEQPRGSATV
jgi:hypothetical protein